LLPTEIFSEPRSSKNEPGADARDNEPVQLNEAQGDWDLTRRQAAVLALMGRGWSNRRIADELGVSEGTVKVHVNAILKVLKVRNRTEAALQLTKRGGSSRRR
jgi:DNA-binding NarL/FixJ family response regulator